jgi:hypothetical protein
MRWLLVPIVIALILLFFRGIVAEALVILIICTLGLYLMVKDAIAAVQARVPRRDSNIASSAWLAGVTPAAVTPAGFPRVSYRALILTGTWARVRLASELSVSECLARVGWLQGPKMKVQLRDQGFRLTAKGELEDPGSGTSWTPEVVFTGTVSPKGSGTNIDLALSWPRSAEIGIAFVYLWVGAVILAGGASIFLYPPDEALKLIGITLGVLLVFGFMGLLQLGPCDALIERAGEKLRGALAARIVSIE